MKKIAFIIGLMIAGILGIFAQNDDSNSENKNRIETQNRDVDNFDKIDIRGRFEVKLTQQENQTLSVEAQQKYLENIETYVKNGTLIVQMKEPNKDKNFIDKLTSKYSDYLNRQRFEVYIGTKNLKEIKMNGASSLSTKNNFKLEKITMDISGASKLSMNCKVENAKIEVSGASTVNIHGKAEDVFLDISGASTFKGNDFECEKIKADVSGASGAVIYVSENFSGEASGASTIRCYGNPKNVQRDVSGASKITIE